MIVHPKPGATVQIWYAKRYAHTMPLHGKLGTVEIVVKGKIKNHGIRIDGRLYAVPCGNLRYPKPSAPHANAA